jgi:hypothetical protein
MGHGLSLTYLKLQKVIQIFDSAFFFHDTNASWAGPKI